MQRTRQITSAERWELGLFLAMLVVGCLLLAVLLHLRNLPRIFAWQSQMDASQQTVRRGSATPAPAVAGIPAAPAAQPTPLLEITPQPQFGLGALAIDDAPAAAQLRDPAPGAQFNRSKPKIVADIKTFDGHKYRYSKTLRLRVTAYAPDPRCTWPYPGTTTASGLSVKTNGGKLVAADTRVISMHSLVLVPGYASDRAVPVLDRGDAIKGSRLDVLLPTFSQAKNWGSRMLEVKIYTPIDK